MAQKTGMKKQATPPRLPSQSYWLTFNELQKGGNNDCYGGPEYPLSLATPYEAFAGPYFIAPRFNFNRVAFPPA